MQKVSNAKDGNVVCTSHLTVWLSPVTNDVKDPYRTARAY